MEVSSVANSSREWDEVKAARKSLFKHGLSHSLHSNPVYMLSFKGQLRLLFAAIGLSQFNDQRRRL